MIKAIIIDDEEDAISALVKLLKNFTTIKVDIIGTANCLEDGIKLITSRNPDLVFLDINMPRADGMSIYKYFDKPKFKVVFVTAYSEYAIEALKKSALDYLLKPISFVELNEAVKKVADEIETEFIHDELEQKLNKLNTLNIDGENVLINVENGFIVENTKNIVYCQADQSYSTIHLFNGKDITVSKPLKHLEELLPEKHFFRTHKSFLVNIQYIKQFVRDSENYIILKNGDHIPVSFRKSSDLEKNVRERMM